MGICTRLSRPRGGHLTTSPTTRCFSQSCVTLICMYLPPFFSPESQLPAMTSHRLSLTSEGSVTQHVPVLARTYCQLDVDRFPYDSQACSLTFSSWVYDVRHLNLTPLDEPVDMTSLVTHSEWEVVRMTVQQTAFSYGGAVFPQVWNMCGVVDEDSCGRYRMAKGGIHPCVP